MNKRMHLQGVFMAIIPFHSNFVFSSGLINPSQFLVGVSEVKMCINIVTNFNTALQILSRLFWLIAKAPTDQS